VLEAHAVELHDPGVAALAGVRADGREIGGEVDLAAEQGGHDGVADDLRELDG
jgi:hypothetical protein